MANTLRFKRGLVATIPTALAGEPLFTTDTFDLYIGNGTGNTRFQKYIASGATTQILRGDGSLYTFPLAISSPSNGQVLKYNGTSWVNDSDSGITGSLTTNYLPKATGATTLGNSLIWDNGTTIGINTTSVNSNEKLRIDGGRLVVLGGTDVYQLKLSYNSATSGFWMGSPSANALSFYNDAGTERARFHATGNFGINTGATDSGEKLQVTGNIRTNSGYVQIRNASNPSLYLNNETIQWQTFVNSSNNLVFSDAINNTLTLAYSTGAATFSSSVTAASFIPSGSSVPTNGMYLGGANTLTFATNSAEKMRLDASGNLGLGITPSAWQSGWKALEITSSGYIAGANSTFLEIGQNNFYDGAFKYKTTNAATLYEQITGSHRWYNAPSGTAGNAITFTQAMTLTAAGRLLLNQTSDTGEQLQVTGTAKITGASTFGDYITQTSAATQIILNRTGGTTYAAGVRYQTSGTNNWIVGTAQATVGTDYSIYNYNTGTGAINITYTTNNVQIGGTTDSGEKLQVNGTAKITGASTFGANITAGTTAAGSIVRVYSSSYGNNGFFEAFGTDGLSKIQIGASSNTNAFIYSPASVGLLIYTGNTLRATLDASGNLAVDGSTFVVDAANNRVGIGNAIPSTELHIQSSTPTLTITSTTTTGTTIGNKGNRLLLLSDSSTVNNGGEIVFGATDTDVERWAAISGAIKGNNASGAIGDIVFATKSAVTDTTLTERVLITSGGNFAVDTNTLFVDATNNRVGIGKTNPSVPLDVVGSAIFSDQITSAGILQNAISNSPYTNSAWVRGASGVGIFLVNQGITAWMGIKTDNTLDFVGAATFNQSIQAATAIAIGTTPDTNNPFKILKNINATVGIKFENTNTSSSAFSAVQLGTDVTGGTKFTNLVYSSSGISASGVYNPDGTSLINNGNGGLNFLGNPIRMYTGGSNGVLRWDLVNDGYITHYSATAPTTSATDSYRQYSADVVAGNAAPHFRTENGAVIKLYQETTAVGNSTISVGGGNAVLDDTEFDGYTLRQIVKALRNQGILA